MTHGYISNFSKKQPFFKCVILLLLATFMSLSACKKEETDNTTNSAVAIYNVSPTAATYDLFINDTKFNGVPLPMGGGTVYSQVTAGTYTLKLSTSGRTESLFQKQVTLNATAYHSIYVVGRPSALDFFQVNDDIVVGSSATNAFVRFVNVSPDAPALDLVIKSGTTVTTSKAFKTASGFIQVPVGATTFELKNSAGVVLASSESTTLAANVYYSVIAKGLLTPSATEIGFAAQVIQHK